MDEDRALVERRRSIRWTGPVCVALGIVFGCRDSELSSFRERPPGAPEQLFFELDTRGGVLGTETWSVWQTQDRTVLLREQTLRYRVSDQPVDRATAEWCELRPTGVVAWCEGRDDLGKSWEISESEGGLPGVGLDAGRAVGDRIARPRTGETQMVTRVEEGRSWTEDGWFRVDASGWLVEAGTGGVVKRRATRAPVTWARVDPGEQMAIPVETIARARQSKTSRWRVSGGVEDRLPTRAGRQWIEGGFLHVRVPLAPEVGRPPVRYAGADTELLVLTEPSGDEALRAEARRAIRGATDRKEALIRLVTHVRVRLVDTPTPGEPDASATLAAGAGDCNDHATLLAALAREVGIPAQIVTGLAYVERPDPKLIPHVWVEVWMDEPAGWVPVDSTFDQWIADATHIALGRGDLATRAKTLGWSGALQVAPVEVR